MKWCGICCNCHLAVKTTFGHEKKPRGICCNSPLAVKTAFGRENGHLAVKTVPRPCATSKLWIHTFTFGHRIGWSPCAHSFGTFFLWLIRFSLLKLLPPACLALSRLYLYIYIKFKYLLRSRILQILVCFMFVLCWTSFFGSMGYRAVVKSNSGIHTVPNAKFFHPTKEPPEHLNFMGCEI